MADNINNLLDIKEIINIVDYDIIITIENWYSNNLVIVEKLLILYGLSRSETLKLLNILKNILNACYAINTNKLYSNLVERIKDKLIFKVSNMGNIIEKQNIKLDWNSNLVNKIRTDIFDNLYYSTDFPKLNFISTNFESQDKYSKLVSKIEAIEKTSLFRLFPRRSINKSWEFNERKELAKIILILLFDTNPKQQVKEIDTLLKEQGLKREDLNL